MAAKPAVSTLEPLEAAQNGQAESSSGAGNASCIRPSGSQPGHNFCPHEVNCTTPVCTRCPKTATAVPV